MNRALRGVMIRGFLLRVGVALFVHFAGLSVQLAPDITGYQEFGAMLGNYWGGLTIMPPQLRPSDPPAYFYIVGLLHYLFSDAMLLPSLLNTVVGAAGIWAVYKLALAV